MNNKEPSVALSERETALVQEVADERGLSLDEAATQLFHEAMAKRFRNGVGRGPAKVFTLPKRTKS